MNRKSKYKPVIPLYDRYKALMAIRYIDNVYVYQTEEELYDLIKFWKPDVRILGSDYKDKYFYTGKDLEEELGIEVYFCFNRFLRSFASPT